MEEKENQKKTTLEGLHFFTADEKKKKIKKKIKELNQIFDLLPDDNKMLSSNLIQNVGFMTVELEELQLIIHETGSVEEYNNGPQRMLKQSAAVQAYNSLLKSYNQSIRLLLAQLPEAESKSAAKDKLTSFLMGND